MLNVVFQPDCVLILEGGVSVFFNKEELLFFCGATVPHKL